MSNKKTLEIIEQLQEVEQKKKYLNEQITAMKSQYFNEVEIRFINDTDDFAHKGPDVPIKLDSILLKQYLEIEIEKIDKISKELIETLHKGIQYK